MDEAFARELETFPWLQNVGEAVTEPMYWPVVQIASWGEAFACFDDDWEALKVTAQDQLTTFLRGQHRDVLNARWNPTIRAIRDRVTTPLTERVWKPYGQRYGLLPVFGDLVASDIRYAAAEHEFRHLRGRPEFFLQLLQVYRAGHFPCGWCGGEWPDGMLVIY